VNRCGETKHFEEAGIAVLNYLFESRENQGVDESAGIQARQHSQLVEVAGDIRVRGEGYYWCSFMTEGILWVLAARAIANNSRLGSYLEL
jgi:hypothetical protein